MISPTSNLVTLLYTSILAPCALISDVADIARTGRRRNWQDDITGLLVFDGSAFVQLVEGPREPVTALLARLANDRRHCDMDVLVFDCVSDVRRFPDWELGYHFADRESDELTSLKGLSGAAALAQFETIRARVDTLAGNRMPAL